MIDTNSIDSVFGAKVVDPDGAKVGTVKQVYVDNNDGSPLFASVATGLFGTSETFVPLEGASLTGDELRVGYDKDRIKDAPRIDADGDLNDDEQDRIFEHYGLGHGTSQHTTVDDSVSTNGVPSDLTDPAGTDPDLTTGTGTVGNGTAQGATAGFADSDTTRSAGHDTSGPNTDEAMTRSEEQLHVGTEQVQAGRARLRKHIVTEQQSVTVPVSHEEVRLESEPITDANVGAATDGPALSEEEHEVTLNEEHVVVDKETVPVERVRLGTETVTEQHTVNEDVAHEEIELDQDGNARR